MNAQQIKDRISVSQILRQYGYSAPQDGRIACPLHKGKNPSSFRFGHNTFYCYSCQESGDIISLVMKLFNICFVEAIRKINADFYLDHNSIQSPSPIAREMFNHHDERSRRVYLTITKSFAKLYRMNADPKFLCEIEDWLDNNLEAFCNRKEVKKCKEW